VVISQPFVLKSSLMVMGILTENCSPAALTVFALSALQKQFFLLLFFSFL
jgi:hypothetical protein